MSGLVARAGWLSIAATLVAACEAGSSATLREMDASTFELAAGNPAPALPIPSLTAVWGAAADDVWAVGGAGTIVHFDGRSWRRQGRVTESDLTGVHGRAADDVWTVGDDCVLHWDGQVWEVALSQVEESLMGVWQRGSDDVWMVGLTWDTDRGLLRHWNGSEWQWLEIGSASTLWEVWGSGADVWFAGSAASGAGFLGRGDGMDFGRLSYAGSSLRSLWGSSNEDVWVAPYMGALEHWDGQAWTMHALPAPEASLLGMSGSGSRDIWAVGLQGVILHWDGDAWDQVPSPTDRTLWSVWAETPDNAWAAGSVLLHWDGIAWQEVARP